MTWIVEEFRDDEWVEIARFDTREEALDCINIERRFGGKFRSRKEK